MSEDKADNFYERAWQVRLDWMRRFIEEEKETNPLKVINRFASFERFHQLRYFPEKKQTVFQPLEVKKQGNFFEKEGQLRISHETGLPTGLALHKVIPFFDQNIPIPQYYYHGTTEFLMDYLANEKFDAIVELGSGYSQNLVKLFYNGGPKIPYYGGEFTQSGTECAALWPQLDPEFQLTPFRFDYNNPDLSAIKEKGRVFFFTRHSIEQVKTIPENLLQTIANHAKEVVCIHFEPIGYQFQLNQQQSEVDTQQRDFFTKSNWNQNLYEVLIRSHQQGHIKIEYLLKNAFGGNFCNPTSLTLWTTKGVKSVVK